MEIEFMNPTIEEKSIELAVDIKKPLVSLGLPVFNGERFIHKAIESVLNQTFGDFELIVCDNASTDRTVEIVNSYAAEDKRIRCYKNETNLGAVPNYRRVLALAKGEYFKWIAADDVITAEFLQQSVDILDKNPEVVLAYSKAGFIDKNDKVIYLFDDVMALDDWSPHPVERVNQLLKAILQDGSAANVVIFGLARTKILRQIKPMGSYFGCDFVYTTDIALQGDIYENPRLMSYYRRHQDSSSSYRRSPSAKQQQEFYDPSIVGYVQVRLQLRRRYFELFRTIWFSNLKLQEKAKVLIYLLSRILRRIGWRLRYEFRMRTVRPENKIALQSETIEKTG